MIVKINNISLECDPDTIDPEKRVFEYLRDSLKNTMTHFKLKVEGTNYFYEQ